MLIPYQSKRLNSIDIESSLICIVTVIFGVFLYNNEFNGWIWFGYIMIGN